MATDLELLGRYFDLHDQAAFAEIVRRYLDSVYSSALRRVGGDVHLAEDVAQQVFAALARNTGRLRSHPVLASWLYRSTRNAAANVVRAERRRKSREEEAQRMHESFANESRDEEWSRLAPALDRALDQLGERDRTAILLRFADRRSFVEIGGILELSEDAARMRIDRALERLRRTLSRRGISSSGVALAMAMSAHAVTAAPAGLAAVVTEAATVPAAWGVSAAGAIGLMTKIKLASVAIVGVAMLASLGLAVWEIRDRQQAKNALAAATRDYDETLARARGAQRPPASSPPAAKMAVHPAAGSVAEQEAASRAFLARHPEVKTALDDFALASAKFQYDAFLRSLGLEPAQIARVEALLMRRMGMGEIGADGQSLNLKAGDGQLPSDWKNQLADLMGEEAMAKFVDYDHETQSRALASRVAGALWFTDTPLSPDQSDQLAEVIGASENPGSANQSRYDWTLLMAKAQGILSAPQLSALAAFQADSQFGDAMRQIYSR